MGISYAPMDHVPGVLACPPWTVGREPVVIPAPTRRGGGDDPGHPGRHPPVLDYFVPWSP
ncbi:hypothetical protein [Dactylosporangium sp. CA-139066]|uniref:hypothetical protein n=1 Tax=Dactylosporangium sp. CA-139066 TaxID=3239930 RepID=UPI003D8EFF82